MALNPRATQYDTRIDMIGLIPKGGVIAEIGVFEATFTLKLLEICRPSEIVLIDCWPDGITFSGDMDGNNVRQYDGAELERTARQRMQGVGCARIIKADSSILRTFPKNYFDALYIDGDHSYEGVMRDLQSAIGVVKDGGWIMGHDYDHNPAKSQKRWAFGVRRAVDVFCRAWGQDISAYGMDGCVSYAIQLRKRGPLQSSSWQRTHSDCVSGPPVVEASSAIIRATKGCHLIGLAAGQPPLTSA
jgi:hypothetical protein